MTRDAKIKDIIFDLYKAKIDLANVEYRYQNMEESIEQTYLPIIKKELELEIKNLYDKYILLNNERLANKNKRR